MKILIAPDKFKDALDADGVTDALAAGARAARPDAEIVSCPLGDGGEGSGRLLARVLGAEERREGVLDPLGRVRVARWWLCPDRRTAIVEMAEASGLALLKEHHRDALRTTSFGTGQLLHAALEDGCERIVLCVGGSATVDGGAGCLQALGWAFDDAQGNRITVPITGGILGRVAALHGPPERPALRIEILCDVDNPLLGPRGAAEVFGPQKGASGEAVEALSRGLQAWADVLPSGSHQDVRVLPGAGAAGGLPAGLVACLDAKLCAGFDEIARRVELRERLDGCDLCLTGEGRLDEQTTGGKVVAGLARAARRQRIPTVAFVGEARRRAGQTLTDLAQAVGVERIVVITPPGTAPSAALSATAANLQRAAREVLAGWT